MDYLTRLIQRTARTAPAVQPLLRSRYAPEESDTSPWDETVDEAVAGEQPSPRGILPALSRNDPAEERPPGVPADDVGEQKTPAGSVAKGRTGPFQVTDTPVPGIEAGIEEVPHEPGQRVPPPAVPSDERPIRMSSALDAGEALARLPGVERADTEDEGLLVPGGEVGESDHVASPGEAAPGVPRGEWEPAEFEPPIIRITIGRIDVRTAPPAPPPAAVTRPAPMVPRLGLDEYLRNGGRG